MYYLISSVLLPSTVVRATVYMCKCLCHGLDATRWPVNVSH